MHEPKGRLGVRSRSHAEQQMHKSERALRAEVRTAEGKLQECTMEDTSLKLASLQQLGLG